MPLLSPLPRDDHGEVSMKLHKQSVPPPKTLQQQPTKDVQAIWGQAGVAEGIKYECRTDQPVRKFCKRLGRNLKPPANYDTCDHQDENRTEDVKEDAHDIGHAAHRTERVRSINL